MMKIRNHKLDGVEFQQARWIGGTITPEIVILHDTAGPLTKGNSAAYLRDNDAKVSVHFVIERDGTIVQQVPTNRRASHAGKSSYHGRPDCNGFAIGIEIVNPGKMESVRGSAFQARAWWGQVFSTEDFPIEGRSTPEHGPGLWMAYSQEQISAVIQLLETLFRDITSLRDIRTHWYVSPGRKTDTNPLFPLEAVRAKVLGRDDPADGVADAGSEEVVGLRKVVSPSGVNMRRWPSFNPNVLLSIPDGTEVLVQREGNFDGRAWLQVIYGGQTGWIVKSYTQPEK